MYLKEITKYFHSLNLKGWKVSGNIRKGGQATTIEVKRIDNGKQGVFRYLKRKKETDIKRFKREVEILSKEEYKHPNLINILEHSGLEENEYWYISEKGESFESYWQSELSKNKGNDEQVVTQSIKIILELLSGLEALHKEQIVHRDIKPDNIIVVNDKIVLIDFGLVFDPKDERLTPEDSAVGNAKYSPDQMMYRLDKAPAWLDVFQISQLLIWMVSKKPTKNWSRPLDWRWVIFRDGISEEQALSLRAFTAITSDPYRSPQNASELIPLIKNMFETNESKSSFDQDKIIEQIKTNIKSGKAKSLILGSEDLTAFSSSFPLYLHQLYLKIENNFNDIFEEYSAKIPMEFKRKQNINDWADKIKSTVKFTSHVNNNPFDFYCGDPNANFFYFTIVNIFYVPSQLALKQGTDYLPEGFLPIAMEIGVGSSSAAFQQKNKLHLYIGADIEGNIWRSDFGGNFKSQKVKTSIEKINSIIRDSILNPENWSLINE